MRIFAPVTCSDTLLFLSRLGNASVDLILCDLPYGVTQNAWDVLIPWEPLWKEYARVIKPRGVIALFGMGRFGAEMIMSALVKYRYSWTWKKREPSGFLDAKRRPLRNHEDIHIFFKKRGTYNPQMTEGKPYTAVSGHVSSKNWGSHQRAFGKTSPQDTQLQS